MKKKFNTPVEKNREYELDIESVTSEGMGIARIDGFCVFVSGTADGDRVKALILKVKPDFAYAKVTKIITPSPYRITPPCPHASKCGGCQLMHINYEKQLDIKRDIIKNALLRIGKINAGSIEMLGSKNPLRYRNKMVFPIGEDKNSNKICGFYRERSHDIVELEDCLLGDESISEIIKAVMDFIKRHNISVYNEEAHKGTVRRLFFRKGFHTGEIMTVLSINKNSLPHTDELVSDILKTSGNVKSIILNINTKKTNAVLGSENKVIFGSETISDILLGMKYEISPTSFFQVNPVQTETLYKKALEFADIKSTDSVMDIYCGIGTISLCAAQTAKKVIGVEIVEEAIANARKNAEENNVKNAVFYASDAAGAVPELIKNGERPNVVILDPPRKGSDEKTLSAIISAQPEKIVYVSCNPATLARDLRFLEDNGYSTKKIAGVDMFPHTMHIETVVLMTLI